MTATLVTGAAGFIGFHTAVRLLNSGHAVIGIDNLTDFYEINLKQDRLEELQTYDQFSFYEATVADAANVNAMFEHHDIENVIHLAGQAGVRAPPSESHRYVESNLVGFCNVMEASRAHKVAHFVYASSSSVYGMEAIPPFSTNQSVNHPQSFYAATKRANELLAHSYSYNYDLATTGLRFFTVYGPWGRPDMAVYKFTDLIAKGQPITLYGEGKLLRDFTYIDDVVDALVRVLENPPKSGYVGQTSPAKSKVAYRIYNVGNDQPVEVNELVHLIEHALETTAVVRYEPPHPADLHTTHADVKELTDVFDLQPNTNLKDGIAHFVEWYLEYHGRDESN